MLPAGILRTLPLFGADIEDENFEAKEVENIYNLSDLADLLFEYEDDIKGSTHGKVLLEYMIRKKSGIEDTETIDQLQELAVQVLGIDQRNEEINKYIRIPDLVDVITSYEKKGKKNPQNIEELVDYCVYNNLESIDFFNFKFTLCDKDVKYLVENFKHLKVVILYSFIDLTNIGVGYLSKLGNLEKLNLAYCIKFDLNSEEFKSLSSLKKLKKLDLTNCVNFDVTVVDTLEKMESLSSLVLPESGVDNKVLKSLSKFTNLTSLSLKGCTKISNKGLKSLAELENLTSLNLSGCFNIKAYGVQYLKKLKHLSHLNLSGCSKINFEEFEGEDWLDSIVLVK